MAKLNSNLSNTSVQLSGQNVFVQQYTQVQMVKNLFELNPQLYQYRPSEVINYLPDNPASDKVYQHGNHKYGRPKFRLKWQQSEQAPAIWFEEDEQEKLWLKLVIEVYREEDDVTPLDFRTVKLKFFFFSKSQNKEIQVPVIVTDAPYINQTNILKNIHAKIEIAATYKEDIYEAFIANQPNSRIEVEADVWWQKVDKDTPPAPDSENAFQLKENHIRFNPKNLSVSGNRIIFQDKKVFLSFPTEKDAEMALKVINHYSLDGRCNIGHFQYFLSNGTAPYGSLSGERAIDFDPNKLQSKKSGNFWNLLSEKGQKIGQFTSTEKIKHAIKVIQIHGFDHFCYVGESPSSFSYLKRLKKPSGNAYTYRLNQSLFNRLNPISSPLVLKPTVVRPTTMNPTINLNPGVLMGPAVSSATINPGPFTPIHPSTPKPPNQDPAPAEPQKLVITAIEYLQFTASDETIFRGLFTDGTPVDHKWENYALPYNYQGQGSTVGSAFYYRRTQNPWIFYALPQAFKLDLTGDKNIPNVKIFIYNEKKEDNSIHYRYKVTCRLLPFFDPLVKKDFQVKMNTETDGEKKYVELAFGGYKSTQLHFNDGFVTNLTDLGSFLHFDEEDFNPVAGFDISINSGQEGFSLLYQSLVNKEDIIIGQVAFKIDEKLVDGSIIEREQFIPIILDLGDPAFIPIESEMITKEITDEAGEKVKFPTAVKLKTDFPFKLSVGGVDLTLLSGVEDITYDADYYLTANGSNWPIEIPEGAQEISLDINQNEVDVLSEGGRSWETLLCAPFNVKYDVDPKMVMDAVIDYATAEPETWVLTVKSPPLSNASNIEQLSIEVRDAFGRNFVANLTPNKPELQIDMSKGLKVSQLMEVINDDKKDFEFRRKAYYSDREGQWEEWRSNDISSTDSLIVYLPTE